MFYAIIFGSSGIGIGSHSYADEPTSYPENEFPCTQVQAQNPSLWQVVNGALVESLTTAQAAQIAAINAAAQRALAAIVAAYPDLEVSTWPQQYAEAQAFTANASAATPMLSAIATACKSTVSAMASGVMTKAAAYQSASGAAIGKRLLLTGEIEAATTVAAVQAVVW